VQIRIQLFFAVAATLLLACAGYSGRLPTEPNKAPQAEEAPVQVQESATIPPNDYSAPRSWLCTPGVKGACNVDLTTTIVAANGTLTRETWSADTKAPIDCFYVYPTVSTDPTPNSDMNPDAAELNVIRQQFARFGSVCRLYAPMYRQVTLAGLRAMFAENRVVLNHGLGYDDVKDAWRYYLERRQQRPRFRLDRTLAGFLRAGGAYSPGNRRQTGAIAPRVRNPARHHRRCLARERCWWIVPARAPVSHGISDRLRDHLRVVPIDHSTATKHPVRQSG
jgi:hypothetical protein